MTTRELIDQRNERIYGNRMDRPMTPHGGMDDMGDHAEEAGLIVSEGGYRLDTRRPMHCTGPCDQGRQSCPHPQACQRPDEDQQSADAAMFLKLLVMSTLSVLLCMALINWLAGA
jgi:hypothetical protein